MYLPEGEIFMNEVARKNSVAFCDNPDEDFFDYLFKEHQKAQKLIYIKNNVRREHLRKKEDIK